MPTTIMTRLMLVVTVLSLFLTLTVPTASAQDERPSEPGSAPVFSNHLWLPFVANATTTDLQVQPTLEADAATVLSSQLLAQQTSVIVILKDQANVSTVGGANRREKRRNLVRLLRNKADGTQANLRMRLAEWHRQGLVQSFSPLWIINGFALTATGDVINQLAQSPEVGQILLDITLQGPAPQQESSATPEQNLSVINAPALWNLGFYGQGVVVASMDTGVDATHPDLAPRWRGGANSWFDPYGQHGTPTDLSGHGTWTMGLMVGGSSGGTAIGVAPQAQWIAVKIFNDSGSATASAIHLGFQWLLDPDNNPATPDGPDIVNNSWTFSTPGCNLMFQADLQALLAAEIIPVFAAGNYGPASPTDVSPANYPEAFAVGAINNNSAIYAYSSLGPTSCGRSAAVVYPALVAPGVNIYTSDLFGLYTANSGTSFAAPHVAGALALLLSAFPNLTVTQQETVLGTTAVDLGPAGPDNSYGAGRLDVLAAYNAVLNLTAVPPTPTNTPVPPTPTNTPTPVPPTPTNTPVSPTNTPLPPTPTPTPTNTPLPPTPTPTNTPVASSDTIFADSFESGNWNIWTATGGNAGRLSVTTAAKQAGVYGLQATISGGSSGYLINTLANNEASYHVRFYFNPNGATINSTAQSILVGYNASNQVIFRIQLRRSSGIYQMRSVVSRSGGTTSTGWHNISNGYHPIEIAWQSATSASFTLYIDGVAKQTLGKLNTSSYTVKTVWLGPSAGLSGSPGSEYFDNVVAKRNSIIGP